jgi:bacillithiol biosynthesis deacetylase BshB1
MSVSPASRRRILAIGAHPDDVEFGCGGILAKEAGRGHEITILNLSGGESASNGTAEVRQKEAESAARILGAELMLLELDGDGRLEYRVQHALSLARVIRERRPEIVLAPAPDENQHPDHAKAGRIARDAARLARYAGLAELKAHASHAIDALYFYDVTGVWDTTASSAIGPLIVDVSPAFETWNAAMACHASQMTTRDYVALQVARARLLGAKIGVAHAMAVRANDAIVVNALTDLPASARRF